MGFFFFLLSLHSGYQDIDRIVLLIRVHTCNSLDFPRPPPQLLSVKSLLFSPSVSGLVLVMPPVEVVVEEDDASGCHAGYDAPEEC